LAQLRVLILEENPFMRRLLRSILRELGVRRVSEAESPDDAFIILKENKIDLVFSDWAPGLDALKFLREVRSSTQLPNLTLPVIIVSAFRERSHVLAARDFGMTEFLAKPISAETVYSRICSVIENRRPFVKAVNFFGPDRRRRRIEYQGTDRRLSAPLPAVTKR
ncbi:MAG: response regulator, partial [Proteobacteria bacterium]|nr:response regulator [Pseudomonadota bacterium]